MFVGLAEEEATYADKMSLFVALGPVAKISHNSDALLNFIILFYSDIARAADLFGIHELFGQNWFTSSVMSLFCGNIPKFCELIESFFVSKKTSLDDDDRFAVYMGHEPNGASVKALLHYAQNMKEDRFQVWADDYTDIFDRKEKRQTDLIPIDQISTVPIAIFTGTEDPLADITDAEWIRDSLKPEVLAHYEEVSAGHLTFMVGKDMTYWSDGVMNLLKQYHPLPSEAPEEFLQ